MCPHRQLNAVKLLSFHPDSAGAIFSCGGILTLHAMFASKHVSFYILLVNDSDLYNGKLNTYRNE
jgi:hypothetical protein